MININNKNWLITKKNNKKYKKQQLIKALNFSYINRKKRFNYNNNIYIKFKIYNILYYNINSNWLLKKI